MGYKVTTFQHISDCNVLRHVYDCGIKNNCQEDHVSHVNIMLRLN